MKRILIFIIFTFFKPASSSGLGISKRKFGWNKTLTQNKNLLSKKYIKTNGWDSVKTHLQENESYWIGARGDYTDFVSWEGCVERLESFDIKEDCHLTKSEDLGSVSKCLSHCSSTYFALQGSDCFCLSGGQRRDCINTTSKQCDNRCLENPNDFCGGNKDVMTLYNKETPDKLKYEMPSISKENCLLLINKQQKTPTYRPANCFTSSRRFICKGPNGTHLEEHHELLTWQQAFDACRQKSESLHYNISNKEKYDNNTYFWTSLKRSFDLIWTTDTDGPKKCAALSKTETSTFVVTLESCTKELRYIYVNEDYGSKEEGNQTSDTTLIIPLVIACIALSTTVGGLCYFRYQSTRKPKVNIQPVYSVVNKPQRQTEPTPQPANHPYYTVVEPGLGRETQTSPSVGGQAGGSDVPTRPAYMYHTFDGVANEEDSFYDSTSTPKGWNKRKQTKDGTIYGMRNAENSYDSASCENSNKKNMAPVSPINYELARF